MSGSMHKISFLRFLELILQSGGEYMPVVASGYLRRVTASSKC